MKKPNIKTTLIIPGIKKYKFIVKTLTINIMQMMGPYKASVNTNGSILSMIPRSFENLLFNLPVGVISK